MRRISRSPHPTTDVPAGARPPSTVVVNLDGTLDARAVPRVSSQLDRALAGAPDEVVVDLACCDFVDATCLCTLLDGHRRARRMGSVLTLANCSPRVLRLLSLTGLRRVFDVRT